MTHETDQPGHQSPVDVTATTNALSATFPGHRVSAERMVDGHVRYIARNRYADINPRVVITRDLAELYAALGGASPRTDPAPADPEQEFPD